jgi:hypothetical protein
VSLSLPASRFPRLFLLYFQWGRGLILLLIRHSSFSLYFFFLFFCSMFLVIVVGRFIFETGQFVESIARPVEARRRSGLSRRIEFVSRPYPPPSFRFTSRCVSWYGADLNSPMCSRSLPPNARLRSRRIVLIGAELLTSDMMIMLLGVVKGRIPWWGLPYNYFVVCTLRPPRLPSTSVLYETIKRH